MRRLLTSPDRRHVRAFHCRAGPHISACRTDPDQSSGASRYRAALAAGFQIWVESILALFMRQADLYRCLASRSAATVVCDILWTRTWPPARCPVGRMAADGCPGRSRAFRLTWSVRLRRLRGLAVRVEGLWQRGCQSWNDLACGVGLRSSHCRNVRRGGRAVTRPPRFSPETSTVRCTGSFQPFRGRILTVPPRTATASASTSMPGLVTRTSPPPRTYAWICKRGWVITASVKSSFTVPPTARISIRAGTTHWPRRVAFPHSKSCLTKSVS